MIITGSTEGIGKEVAHDLARRGNYFQGRSQPHSPGGGARVPLSSFIPQILINFSYFSSNFTYFLPRFGPPGTRPPGKALATPLIMSMR